MSNTTQKQKRSDIQGLRAIAIFGVLLFHLAPKRFINGFLGVDTFFVLSGYLMSSILSRESTIDGAVVKGFYIRRFKRIVPLYSIMLVILAVIAPLVFLPSDMVHFIADMEWALPFAENMQNVLKKYDYWDEVFSSPVLLHAWSLGVEIQYYLIVPFIMIVARFGQTRRFRMIAFLVFIGASYALHLISSTTVSFGLLFARVWQFLTGSIFFELEGALDDPTTAQYQAVDQEKLLDDDEDGIEDLELGNSQLTRKTRWSSCLYTPLISFISYCVTCYLLWMVIMSMSGPKLSRFFVTFATGNLLLLGKYTQNRILANDIMVYIGDLSYLIYLAHWPVIVLYKYYGDISDLTIPDMSFCLLSTLIISVLLHHSLERLFITASTVVSFVFVAGVYLMIVVALMTGSMQRLSEAAHPLGQEIATTRQTERIPTTRWTTVAPTSGSSGRTNATTPIAMLTTTAKKVEFNRQEAVQWNQAQSKVVYFRNPDGCVRDFEAERRMDWLLGGRLPTLCRSNGTAKVLVTGNSYGYRAFPVLHRLFAGRYAQMRMFTRSSRVYLTKDPESTKFADKEKIVVEKFQPDITFLIEKDSFETLMKPIVGRIEDDPISQHIQAAVNVLSNNSGTVVVDQQYVKPAFKDGVAYMIQKRLQQGKTNFEDLKLSRKEYELAFSNEIARMATIKNDNVIVNSVEDQLCPGEYCYFFNRDNMHSYYGDNAAHMTTEGLKMLEPKYSEIIEDFLLRLQSSKMDSN